MNRVGIMVDLSHVGAKTFEETILASKKPVTYSHCLPAGLKEHPRNKSDVQLKFIADHGGFIGVTTFPPFLKRGIESTVDDCVEAIGEMPNLTAAMERAGWKSERITKVMGCNGLRIFKEVWGR